MFHLICTQDFDDYKKGDRIEDPDAVASALENQHHHVVKVAAPEPLPKSKAKAD